MAELEFIYLYPKRSSINSKTPITITLNERIINLGFTCARIFYISVTVLHIDLI